VVEGRWRRTNHGSARADVRGAGRQHVVRFCSATERVEAGSRTGSRLVEVRREKNSALELCTDRDERGVVIVASSQREDVVGEGFSGVRPAQL